MKKLFLSIITLIIIHFNSSAISYSDSLKADSCGIAGYNMDLALKALPESDFCKFRVLSYQRSTNVISEPAFDAALSSTPGLLVFMNEMKKGVLILNRNSFFTRSTIGAISFERIMNNKWNLLDIGIIDNGCANFKTDLLACDAYFVLCVDAAAIGCIGTTLGYPACLAAGTGLCLAGRGVCRWQAKSNNPGCTGSTTEGDPNPWLHHLTPLEENVGACD